MMLKVNCLPYAVGKQPSIPLINLGREWTLNWWWWWNAAKNIYLKICFKNTNYKNNTVSDSNARPPILVHLVDDLPDFVVRRTEANESFHSRRWQTVVAALVWTNVVTCNHDMRAGSQIHSRMILIENYFLTTNHCHHHHHHHQFNIHFRLKLIKIVYLMLLGSSRPYLWLISEENGR